VSTICGILRFDETPIRESDLERQINTMIQRGPDRRRTWCDGPIGLGHALMRVTEEDAFDDQPLVDRTAGLALVADLRLDNREELAEALGIDSERLAKLADSALLVRAYQKWGEDCAEHLLGDFAFAIWDSPARKLVLGRDHMGARFVHYYRGPGFFVFASEKKGLWAIADVPHRLDEFDVGKALTLDLSQGRGTTMFAEIFGLLPATIMTATTDGVIESRRYWQPHADPVHLGRDEAYYIEAYRRALAEAVACRLRRNTRPAGLFLSGGFDSATIAALAAPVMAAQKRKLVAAGSGLPKAYDETRRNARKWVEACERHMPHLDVRYVTREGFGVLDNLDEWFLRTDGRSSPDRPGNNALFTAIAESGACVVTDGYGGDYTVNPRARGWLAEQLLHGRLGLFFSELRAYRRNRDLPFWPTLKQEVIKPILPGIIWRMWLRFHRALPPGEPIVPLSEEYARSIQAMGGHLRFTMPKMATKGYLGRVSAVLAHEQGKPDNSMYVAAAPFGLEYVQPFHDKRVVELGLAIPASLHVRGGRNRYLARKSMADILPPELLTRRDENDGRTPDMLEIAERARPQMLQEIARMESDGRMARYFDFAKMRNMLDQSVASPYGSALKIAYATRSADSSWPASSNGWSATIVVVFPALPRQLVLMVLARAVHPAIDGEARVDEFVRRTTHRPDFMRRP
jgi:asparagine synthase (glutamine-hydrolysing)